MPPTKNPKQRPAPQTARESSQNQPHPSRGGSRGYSHAQREFAMEIRAAGEEDNPVIDQQRQNRTHPSKTTAWRWNNRLTTEGHYHPCEMVGNRPATVLKGHPLLMPVIHRMMHPKATAAEINAFLFACTLPGQQYRFYTEGQITEAENWLGVSRKRASTTAYQASLPINQAKRNAFWNFPYPAGINGTSRSRIIDFDEAAIFVESTNGGYGKCFIGSRCREHGPCSHSEKFTLTAAIRGGPGGGAWVNCEIRPGTTVLDTHRFLNEIINGAPGGPPGGGIGNGGGANTHTFICDNLQSHHNPLIRFLVNNHGHRLVFRAPYHPQDGPIEYLFNTIQQQLTLELHGVQDAPELIAAVQRTVQRQQGEYDAHFAHCGYAP